MNAEKKWSSKKKKKKRRLRRFGGLQGKCCLVERNWAPTSLAARRMGGLQEQESSTVDGPELEGQTLSQTLVHPQDWSSQWSRCIY